MAAIMTDGRMGVTVALSFNGVFPPQGNATTSTLPSVSLGFAESFGIVHQYGGTSGLINTEICQENTLAGAGTVTLNLFDGSILDINGKSGALSQILFICIQQIANPDASAAASSLTIGDAAATANKHQLWFSAATQTYTVKGLNGIPLIQGDDAGKLVDNTHKLLLITNDDPSFKATFRLSIAGWHV